MDVSQLLRGTRYPERKKIERAARSALTAHDRAYVLLSIEEARARAERAQERAIWLGYARAADSLAEYEDILNLTETA